ncbi:hypothetical protein JNL27_06815 [bacterium]|nr:hypothetical protein [bacterium]
MAQKSISETLQSENLFDTFPKESPIENGFLYDFGERVYRVLEMNLVGLSRLKVNLKVTQGAHFHIDTLDLYLDRARERYAQVAAERFQSDQAETLQELYTLIEKLDEKRVKLLQNKGETVKEESMSTSEREEALRFLKSPNLTEEITCDFDKCGLIGEETSRLFGYLATISRFLEKPLGLLIVSRSGAGKSELQEVIGKFILPVQLKRYTRISGQSLFYQQNGNLKNCVIAIAEEKGAEDAIYSIRTLQSDQYLTVAVTSTDQKTGIKRTDEYRVEGPVVIIITTTNPEALDFETRNRFVILTIDESREQTRRILKKQREQESLEGLVQSSAEEIIIRKHHNAQKLLKASLKVVNPFSDALTYPDDKLLMRREQKKYLTLIKTIAFLHQYQREIKRMKTPHGEIEYIEVTLADIALANKLAADVLGRSLDELSPHTRNLLNEIKTMIDELSKKQNKKPDEILFSRRDIREHTGWSYWQVYDHIKPLLEMEYLLLQSESRNRPMYRLLWNGEGKEGGRFLIGLIDTESLKKQALPQKRRALP